MTREIQTTYKTELEENGFTIIPDVFTAEALQKLITFIETVNSTEKTLQNKDLIAIRQFLKKVPGSKEIIVNDLLKILLAELFGIEYFIVKSIYFDKPEASNWFVSYHQDLTIAVDQKHEIPGFSLWTKKEDHFAVQPPNELLENIITVRIHLDDTDENNGALKVITGSHKKGIHRKEKEEQAKEKEYVCSVPKGSIMIMKPLLLHSSGRTKNNKRRRVIHIEFSNVELPHPLKWAERENP